MSAEFDEELQKGFEILFFVVFLFELSVLEHFAEDKRRKERVFSEELVSE